MKISRSSRPFLTLLGCLSVTPFVLAQGISDGPETTLDTMWASVGHLQSLVDSTVNHISMERFEDSKASRISFSGLGSFGNARVRNNHPAFDYNAGGYAVSYDHSKNDKIFGLALGQAFGCQRVKEMPDYPDGPIAGDRYRQDSFMANLYGGLCYETGRRSNLIVSMNIGVGSTRNRCGHDASSGALNRWSTLSVMTGMSIAWRYQVTSSLSVTPFAGINYTNSENKKKSDEYELCDSDHDLYWDDYYGDDHYCQKRDNIGKYDNLALEAGVTLEHVSHFGSGASWTNSIAGSVCPDVLRNDPHHTFVDGWWDGDLYREDRYKGKGYSPSRQAFKVRFMSRFRTSGQSSVYVSYQATIRDAYVSHNVALGFSHSF